MQIVPLSSHSQSPPSPLLSPPVGKSPGRTVTFHRRLVRPRLRISLLCSKYMVSLRSDFVCFLPSAFLLLSILTFSVVETLKGPFVRLSEISSIAAAAATEITFVLPSFRPALQPISEGSPIDRPCPSLLPFSPFSLSSSVFPSRAELKIPVGPARIASAALAAGPPPGCLSRAPKRTWEPVGKTGRLERFKFPQVSGRFQH